MGFNELKYEVENRLYPNRVNKKRTVTPSSDFSTSLNHLVRWNLIEKESYEYIGKYTNNDSKRQIRSNYSITQIGEIYYREGYDPDQITNITRIILLICISGLDGISKIRDITSEPIDNIQAGCIIVPTKGHSDQAKNKRIPVKVYTREKQVGISSEDISDGRYKHIHPLFSNLKSDQNQAKQCFDFLVEKEILKPQIDKKGVERFVLSNNQIKKFIEDCIYDLFDKIELRLSIKIEYLLRNVNRVEEDWLITMIGKDKFDKKIRSRNSIRNGIKLGEIKKSDSRSIKYNNDRIRKINLEIIKNYKDLIKNPKSLSDTQVGILHLILTYIYPRKFAEMIEMELLENKVSEEYLSNL
jgi:hypothetical protein